MRNLIVILVVGALVSSSIAQNEVKCDYRTQDSNCMDVLPFCKSYTYEKGQDEKYTFKCSSCDNGFDPIPQGVSGLSLDTTFQVPASADPNFFIELCQRVSSIEDLWCNNLVCHKELPHCNKYRVENVEPGLDIEGKEIFVAEYTCLECTSLYEPIPTQKVSAPIDSKHTKSLCHRKMEARECGEQCQKEFPGCLFYVVKNREYATSADGQTVENADFHCIQPMPGYNSIMRPEKYTALHSTPKEIVQRNYESGRVDCNDLTCTHVFPNCLAYGSISIDESRNAYRCIECRDGFKAKDYDVYGKDYFMLNYFKEPLNLCEIQAFTGKETDDDWRDEIPGCKKLTVSKVGNIAGRQIAHYTCNECDEGLEPILDGESDFVSSWGLANNLKYRCRPKVIAEAIECTGECRNMLKNCVSYSATYDERMPAYLLKYECLKCDSGFYATSEPEFDVWNSRIEKNVCKPEVIEGAKECDELCQETFPNCKRISITESIEKHNIYQCNECEQGYSPISYEEDNAGILSNPKSAMRRSNQIFLCSNNPDEIYLAHTDCSDTEMAVLDSLACHKTINCLTVVEARDLKTGNKYEKCVKCPAGFKVKETQPHPYDIDQRACERVPA